MSAGETIGHKKLKTAATCWAVEQGYTCVGSEIHLPNSGFRADVAAYKPQFEIRSVVFEGRKRRQRLPVIGSSAIFECKQARADLFKDSCLEAKVAGQLKKLQSRRETIERLLRIYYPAARIPDSLFDEFQTCDFVSLGHKGYSRIIEKVSALQNALINKNKFEKLTRYRCANLFYLVTPPEILEKYELPPGWGLLTTAGDGLKLIQQPTWFEASEGVRLAVLQQIGKVRTKRANVSEGFSDWKKENTLAGS